MNLTIVLGSITTIFLICFALVLLSLKFYILQKVAYQKAIATEAKERYETPEFLSLADSIRKHNGNLSRMESFYRKEVHISGILKNILAIERQEGIVFNNIVIDQAKPVNTANVSIYGQSDTRDALVIFKESVENQKGIKNVTLPAENLIKPVNNNFHLKFEWHEKPE